MFTDPFDNLKRLDLKHGECVADIGCGTGTYTLEASMRVGDEGRVTAVDIQEPLIRRLTREASQQGLRNVEGIHGNAEKAGGTRIGAGTASAVIVSNVLFTLENRDEFAREMARILAPEGRLLLIDWSGSFKGLGPPADRVISKDTARLLFEDIGFAVESEYEAGSYHYGMIFTGPTHLANFCALQSLKRSLY